MAIRFPLIRPSYAHKSFSFVIRPRASDSFSRSSYVVRISSPYYKFNAGIINLVRLIASAQCSGGDIRQINNAFSAHSLILQVCAVQGRFPHLTVFDIHLDYTYTHSNSLTFICCLSSIWLIPADSLYICKNILVYIQCSQPAFRLWSEGTPRKDLLSFQTLK